DGRFFFSSRRRHTRWPRDWSSDVCSSDLMMQGQRDFQTVSRLIMSELTPLVGAGYGAFFLMHELEDEEPELRLIASFGYQERKRSEERRVGKEGRAGWWREHQR